MLGNKSLFVILAVTGLIFAYWYNPFSSRQIGKGPVVKTLSGKLRGNIAVSRTGKEFYEYLGVPYARPPIGEKRFEPPEPPVAWEGVRDATALGAKCLQLEMLSGRLDGSEDCLFLNLYVPKKRYDKQLPVMLFIHGGAFVTGSSNAYGASYFMDEQVILVTINYRLAALGFLNTGDSVIRGNMGLKDQVRALNWIKANIESFGGDPNRVTIFGESAGAASVQFHILSPQSKGLFWKAIAQSGSPLNHWALRRNPKQQAQRFAAKFNCPLKDSKEMAACLKKVDGLTLVNEHREMLVPMRDPITLFVPTIEVYKDKNTFLGEEPLTLLKEGRFNKVPLISGVNSEEGLLTSAVITANQTKMDQAQANFSWWASNILSFPEDEAKAKLIRKFYFGDREDIATKSLLKGYTNMFSDRYFFTPAHKHAQLYSHHASIRLYYYTHRGDFSLGNIMAASQGRFPVLVNVFVDILSRKFRSTILREVVPHMGTAHADEIPFFFEFLLGSAITPGDKDYELSSKMVKLWVSFATNDNSEPVKYGDLLWLPQSSRDTKMTYLQIDTNSALIDEPFLERVKFWESLQISD